MRPLLYLKREKLSERLLEQPPSLFCYSCHTNLKYIFCLSTLSTCPAGSLCILLDAATLPRRAGVLCVNLKEKPIGFYFDRLEFLDKLPVITASGMSPPITDSTYIARVSPGFLRCIRNAWITVNDISSRIQLDNRLCANSFERFTNMLSLCI